MNHCKRIGMVMMACSGLAVTASATAAPSSRPPTASEKTLCHRLYQFETVWSQADFKTLGRMLAPGYAHTDDRGEFLLRSDWLEEESKRAAVVKTLVAQMSDVRILMLKSGRAAIITGKMTIGRKGNSNGHLERGRFTQVWVDNPSGWQRLAFQLEPVVDNMKFSHMKCTDSSPRVCTGQVRVTVPGPSSHPAALDVDGGKKDHCTFVRESGMSSGKASATPPNPALQPTTLTAGAVKVPSAGFARSGGAAELER